MRYGLAAAFKQQIDAGEAFDVVVLTPPLIDDAIKRGLVAADTRSVIGRAGIGVAIRAGAPRPDIGSTEAFKSALLAAKSVSFAKEGASGAYFAGLIGRLGIADAMSQKLKPMPTGVEVGEAVAHGEVELAVLPISEILPIQGAELLGAVSGRRAELCGDDGGRRRRQQGARRGGGPHHAFSRRRPPSR